MGGEKVLGRKHARTCGSRFGDVEAQGSRVRAASLEGSMRRSGGELEGRKETCAR